MSMPPSLHASLCRGTQRGRRRTRGACWAARPPAAQGCIRTIYLCDDGKDAGKEAWVEGLNRTGEAGCPVVYIRGHPREPGEVNGKSGNLNNALSNVLYPGGADPGSHEARLCLQGAT